MTLISSMPNLDLIVSGTKEDTISCPLSTPIRASPKGENDPKDQFLLRLPESAIGIHKEMNRKENEHKKMGDQIKKIKKK